MLISQIAEILEAEVLCGRDHFSEEILSACGSDMMSDVLAFNTEHAMLLTGLMNPQTIRTAEMLDIRCVAFVRGKKPGEDILKLAQERGIVVLSTRFRLYTACGKLYKEGLGGGQD